MGDEGNQKLVFIAMDFPQVDKDTLIRLSQQFKDVFTWGYEDMKGMPLEVVSHTIPMRTNA